MRKRLLTGLVAAIALIQSPTAIAGTGRFSFGVIPFPATAGGEKTVIEAITDTDADNLAFVIALGIKSAGEPCSDSLYSERKALFDSAKNGLVVTPTAADWANCSGANGRASAMERLSRLREVFFIGEFSIGATKIPVVRQSSTAVFRSYGENVRWVFGRAMFAVVNLPANNNHYLSAAGRNSEFEDRQVANRYWLNRVFTEAKSKKLQGIVIFSDANPLSAPRSQAIRRDGFAETRRQILALAAKFPGKVLLVHGTPRSNAPGPTQIDWHGNVGVVQSGSPWVKLTVDPSTSILFSVANRTNSTKGASQ